MRLRPFAAGLLVLCPTLACSSDEDTPGGNAGGSPSSSGDAGASAGPPAAGAPGAGSGGTGSGTGGAGISGAAMSGAGASTAGAGGGPSSAGAGGTSGGRSGGNAGRGGSTNTAGSTSTAGQAGASSGCGKSGAPTGVQEESMEVGANLRTFVLSVPAAYDASKPLPLVLAWHGLGGSGSLARRYFQIEPRAGIEAIVVYPDGLPQGEQDQTGWDLGANGIDVAFFDALVAGMSSTYCVDPNRVFSTGHSFGAMMTNALGCSRGNVLRAIAPVAGMPPRRGGGAGAACTGEVAAWIAHGENDETVDYTTGGVATRDFWLGRNGCSTTDSAPSMPSECVAYSGCMEGLPVEWCVHQDGHDWPSFAGAGIWSFFSSFQ